MDNIYVKEASQIKLADYAVENLIPEEPVFAWWVRYTLKKINMIISKVKTKYWRKNHKYVVRIPTNVTEAIKIYHINGNNYWKEAIEKEMKRAKIPYEPIEYCTLEEVRKGKVDDMHGYREITCHVISEMKMDFTQRARFVANGSKTEAPVALTYSSVVSRYILQLALLITAKNDLDGMTCDIGNIYLNAPCKDKIWFKTGE